MAYSDYGGMVYKNGKRVIDRCDTCIDEVAHCDPAIYPTLSAIAEDALTENHKMLYPSGHAVLGSGPLYMSLYKQSSLSIHVGNSTIPLTSFANVKQTHLNKISGEYYIHTEALIRDKEIVFFDLPDGYSAWAHWIDTINHYMLVKLCEPNGDIWHGGSGDYVGSGFEGADFTDSFWEGDPDREIHINYIRYERDLDIKLLELWGKDFPSGIKPRTLMLKT